MADDTMDWNTLANTRLADVEPPKKLPPGHYQAIITGPHKADKTTKGTLFVEFPIRLTEPMQDVDEEELAAAGGLADNKFSLTFYLTEKSLFRFTDFVKGMGGSDDLNVLQGAEWLVESGEPFVVTVAHEQSDKNPERTFMRIDDAVPLNKFA